MMGRSRAETIYAIFFYLQPTSDRPKESKGGKVTFHRIKQAMLSRDSSVLSRFWEAETALEVAMPREI